MATTPVYAASPRWGSVQLANGDGTTESASAFTAGSNGSIVNKVTICSGPTTAPGGTYKVAIKVHDGTNSRVRYVVTLTNAVDTLHETVTLNLKLPASHSIRFQMRTTLASGATLDCTVEGVDA